MAQTRTTKQSARPWRRIVASGRPSGWTVLSMLAAAAISLPIFVVAANIFAPTGEIWNHLASTVLPDYISNTIWLMVGVAAGVSVGGVGSAWLVSLCDFPGRRFAEWALLLPFAVPAYVIAYTYTGLFEFAGPIQSTLRDLFGWHRGGYWFPDVRSLEGAIVMMVLVLYPYVYLLSRAAFLEQSVCTLEVSRTLGCGPWASMFRVALPLARPSIAAGIALALMEALNDFGTVQYFGVDTFTTGIYRTWLGLGQPEAAAQLAAVLMLFIFALVLLERWSRGRASYQHLTSRYRPLPTFRLSGARAVAAALFCFTPVFFGFLLPAGALAVWTVRSAAEVIDDRFVTLVVNSFTLSVLAALIAVSIAVLLAYALRLRGNAVTAAMTRVASLGYAIPGAVIAIGVFMPFGWVDRGLNGASKALFGAPVGLVVSGTIVILLFAYTVRFLAIAIGTVESGFSRVTGHMDDAARTLGSGPAATVRRIHAPIMRGSLLTAGLLVFVDVMKELPATIMLRPFNFDTLAVRTYAYAVDEQLVEAAPSALAIVLVGILPVILLSRAITRSRPGTGAGRARRVAAAAEHPYGVAP
ncbi:MAG: iron ABC transporter permease [Pseudomonadota bacterium]